MSGHAIPSEGDWSEGQTQVFLFVRTAKGNVISLINHDAVRRGAIVDFQRTLAGLARGSVTTLAHAPGRLTRRTRSVLELVESAALSPSRIALQLGISRSNASMYLGKMRNDGLVEKAPDGWTATQAGRFALTAGPVAA